MSPNKTRNLETAPNEIIAKRKVLSSIKTRKHKVPTVPNIMTIIR